MLRSKVKPRSSPTARTSYCKLPAWNSSDVLTYLSQSSRLIAELGTRRCSGWPPCFRLRRQTIVKTCKKKIFKKRVQFYEYWSLYSELTAHTCYVSLPIEMSAFSCWLYGLEAGSGAESDVNVSLLNSSNAKLFPALIILSVCKARDRATGCVAFACVYTVEDFIERDLSQSTERGIKEHK